MKYISFLNFSLNFVVRLYTGMRAHAHTRHMQPIIHSRPKASAMDSTVVLRAHLFISLYLLGPTDNADPSTSPQMRPFPPKREADNIHTISIVLLSQFFPLPEESSWFSTNQTQGLSNSTNSSQRMSSEAFWTPNTALLQIVELPEPGSRSKSSPN